MKDQRHPDLTCIACKYFQVDTATPDYSEITPGTDFDMYCLKDLWRFDKYGTQEAYVKCLQSAPNCPKFERRT